jgi:hypothetical protein
LEYFTSCSKDEKMSVTAEIGLFFAAGLAATLIAGSVTYLLVTRDFFLPFFLSLGKEVDRSMALGGAFALISMVLVSIAGVEVYSFLSLPKRLTLPSDPIYLWHQMGWITKAVVVILFLMSGWSIGVMVDRWVAYRTARKQSRAFAPAALRGGEIMLARLMHK